MKDHIDYSKPPISKRAWEMQDLIGKIKEIWRDREGPFENIFRILSYLIPFVPSLGWAVFALESIASYFGYGMSHLGKAIDNAMGLQAGPHLNINERTIQFGLNQLFAQAKAAADNSEDELVKVAWISGLFKMVGAVPKIAKILWTAVKALLFMFGVTKVGDLYTMVTGETRMPGEIMLEDNKKEEEGAVPSINLEDATKLLSLVKDPSKIMNPFGG